MKNTYDAIIIGAGPAGLSCGTELASRGLDVAVLDEQASPGGQIYRNVSNASSQQNALLGKDYSAGMGLVTAFRDSGAEYFPQTRVWQAEPNGDAFFSRHGASSKVSAPYIVLSTGAMERPVPFPGWILPGVMTCGGMSNLLKDSGLVPAEPVVIAGSGPLLWLVAEHLLELGAPVAAILDTTPLTQMVTAMSQMPKALLRLDYLLKGVSMIAKVHKMALKAKVPMYRGVTGLRAEGTDKVERVRATCRSKELEFAASTLLVHEGIIPNTALLRQVGVKHTWNEVQRYWHPEVGSDGRTNLPSVFTAGDGSFVHGALSAEYKGRLTGLTIAHEMRRISGAEFSSESSALGAKLHKELLPRPFVDAMYAPRGGLYALADEETVCRCENVTAGRIRELVAQGFTDHNEIKSIIRCGMGPCQGRMCGPAVMELVAEAAGISAQDARPLRLRPPVKPVSLQEMANAELGNTAGDDA